MAKYDVELVSGVKFTIEADAMQPGSGASVTFTKTIIEPDPYRRDSFGGPTFSPRYEIVGYFGQVASAVKAEE